MSVRVRFAPSPTGYLHIGGARTALYNFLYAQAKNGTFILRIEDTDLERSKREYEESQIDDLKWLGLKFDEGPGVGGDYGPYRQSERLDIYKENANWLVDKNKAFYCFCSDEELEEKKNIALKEGKPPHYDGKCKNLSMEEATGKLAAGETAVIRFKAPSKPYVLHDLVRGRVVFPENMVGDFVILRSNGMPVYNFCCVVDDWKMKITHVLRAEDHLSNTVRQLMIYEAFEAPIPEFGHVSLLIGKDRQKLSKRHGATSVLNYREDTYLPEAMKNYLCQLGWSHPEEKDIFTSEELKNVFDLSRFSKAPAVFDKEKFNWVNGQHLRRLSLELLISECAKIIPAESPFHKQSHQWQQECLQLFKEQIEFFKEIVPHLEEVFSPIVHPDGEYEEILSWETTKQMKVFLLAKMNELKQNNKTFAVASDFNTWQEGLKKDLNIKGKPLFKGMRALLTGKGHGPELTQLIPLTPLQILMQRVESTYGNNG